MSYHETLGAIGWLAFALLAAWLATWLMPDEWYSKLSKPGWNPPDKLYVPVWIVTYALMGAAAWLIWKSGGVMGMLLPLGLFAVQLVLQVAWSWLLFGRHRIDLALIDIVAVWVLLLATLVLFWGVLPLTGILLIPSLAWVSFAAALTGAIWHKNRNFSKSVVE
ncbi:MAG: TspO/MBR family protein [Anaerolineales bacterium]